MSSNIVVFRYRKRFAFSFEQTIFCKKDLEHSCSRSFVNTGSREASSAWLALHLGFAI
jgi:hypothetical protein